jgi:hypothetical protein
MDGDDEQGYMDYMAQGERGIGGVGPLSLRLIQQSWLVGAPLATTDSFTLILVDIAPFPSLDEEVTGGACARPFRSPTILCVKIMALNIQ